MTEAAHLSSALTLPCSHPDALYMVNSAHAIIPLSRGFAVFSRGQHEHGVSLPNDINHPTRVMNKQHIYFLQPIIFYSKYSQSSLVRTHRNFKVRIQIIPNSQKTPYNSPCWDSYGISSMSILQKTDQNIMDCTIPMAKCKTAVSPVH